MSSIRILCKHALKHVPELKVGDEVLKSRFDNGCSMSNCRGKCCRLGVDLDLGEQERILEHANVVRRYMDEDQQQVSADWFGEEFADPDYPSGRAVSTRLYNGNCVFLNKDARCALQIAESQADSATGELKPFFCRAYPLTIDDGILVIDDEQSPGESRCCGPVANGSLTIFDVCAFELKHVLGTDGLSELRAIATESSRDSDPEMPT